MDYGLFCHLDDYGLSASEFRVAFYIAQRTEEGQSAMKVKEMARTCRVHEQTVRSVIKRLRKLRVIEIIYRSGEASEYQITHPSNWKLP